MSVTVSPRTSCSKATQRHLPAKSKRRRKSSSTITPSPEPSKTSTDTIIIKVACNLIFITFYCKFLNFESREKG